MTKNWKKLQRKIFCKIFFWSKTAIYLSLGLHKVYPSYRRSLQFSKEAIQHFKTWTFTNYCLLLWVIFALLDPDPDSEYGSGSTDPIEYGSNTDTDPVPDPDPQPWTNPLLCYRIWHHSSFAFIHHGKWSLTSRSGAIICRLDKAKNK